MPPFGGHLHRERKHIFKCQKDMKKEEVLMGAVVAPSLLAILGFPGQWNRGLQISRIKGADWELSPLRWPLNCRRGTSRNSINLDPEAVNWVRHGIWERWVSVKLVFPGGQQIFPLSASSQRQVERTIWNLWPGSSLPRIIFSKWNLGVSINLGTG